MRRILVAFLLLALLAPAAGALPPDAVQTFPREGHPDEVVIAVWVGPTNDTHNITVKPGESSRLWFALHRVNASTRGVEVMTVNLTAQAFPLSKENITLTLDTGGAQEWAEDSVAFTLPANASGQLSYAWVIDAHLQANGTTEILTSRNCTCFIYAESSSAAPVPPGTTAPWLFPALVGVVAVAAVGSGVAAYRSRQRRLMNEAPLRSQVLREMALEKELEKARGKDPERAVEIKQELRQQEQVREKRREVQILEAKRADVLKSIELLKKRHELGALSKHQLDTMVAKKQQDLAKVDADLAAMEAEDNRDPSAAA